MNESNALNLSPVPQVYWPRLAGSPGKRAAQVLAILTALAMVVAVVMALRVPPDTVPVPGSFLQGQRMLPSRPGFGRSWLGTLLRRARDASHPKHA